MANLKRKRAHFNGTSWEINKKELNDIGQIKYSPKAGYKTKEEAEAAAIEFDEEFERRFSNRGKLIDENTPLSLFLQYYFEEILRTNTKIDNSTIVYGENAIFKQTIPRIETDLPLKSVNNYFIEEILEKIAGESTDTANSVRFYLKMAFDYAVQERLIPYNFVADIKPYARKKPKIKDNLFNKPQTRVFLIKAALGKWYLEILLALFLGLRKGEILGLKVTDFDFDNNTVFIQRQITSNPERIETAVGDGIKGKYKFKVAEKNPKKNSFRVLKCPEPIMKEVEKRIKQIEQRKAELGDDYYDKGYLSCQPDGAPHNVSSLNQEITKICKAASLPHMTVHGLRHMFATILGEQNVKLEVIAGMLGHKNVMTTYEHYLDVIEGYEIVNNVVNELFPGGDRSERA